MRLGSVALALLGAGCAGLPSPSVEPLASHLDADGPTAECARFFVALDGAVAEAGVADPEAARVPGYPYLRVDRLLAFGAKPDAASPAFPTWIDALMDLDRSARGREIDNLPEPVRARERRRELGPAPLMDLVRRCGETLRDGDLAGPAGRKKLAATAVVPPSYSVAKRVLGLYPLTSIPFGAGVERLHAETREVFRTPLAQLPVRGSLTRFRPAEVEAPGVAEAILARSPVNALGIVEPNPSDRTRLLRAFAPIWEVDVTGDDDRLGTPRWSGGSIPEVDVSAPAAFHRVSHTRLEGRLLLQLNYTIWFPARPRSGTFDLLAGHLDGITWRVTLAPDGRPLMYDTMHNCGCYHMFLPAPGVVLRESARDEAEPPLVSQTAPMGKGRVVIRIAHRTHYVQRAYLEEEPSAGESYELRDYDELRSLPLAGRGRRSLFGPDGLVPGTERAERWLFWPMGVASAGAMRAWGHHAIVFVGQRHFDDPDLIDRYFSVSGIR